ncbi:MAG TPA: hypothetical protein VNN17_13440 [Terriglobia bacterium]|nr:hypothetical protein [Terriglobia bacterium]
MSTAQTPPPPRDSGLKRTLAPAAGALAGTSAMVLLVELARSGALAQYKDLLAPLIGWGPGLLVLGGFLWLAHSYGPPFLESQRSTAAALQKLADTVEHTSTHQQDLVLAVQVNSDKLEQLRATVSELQEQFRESRFPVRDAPWMVSESRAEGPESRVPHQPRSGNGPTD